jgi:hypothetical protein
VHQAAHHLLSERFILVDQRGGLGEFLGIYLPAVMDGDQEKRAQSGQLRLYARYVRAEVLQV